MNFDELIQSAVDQKASDVHLSSGKIPMMRINGVLNQCGHQIVTHDDIVIIINQLLSDKQQCLFQKFLTIDCTYDIQDVARLRINCFQQLHGISIVCRILAAVIPTLDSLKLPPIIKSLTNYNNGLVLVTGATGSGKSTTLAAMIDFINSTNCYHIITIEDPIEYIYHNQKCLIHQREVGRDVPNFHTALCEALRADPDVILIGELRDLPSMRLALTAAETGHLVFATLHTNSVVSTISRIIDLFPGNEQLHIRSILSESLQAVITQQLLININNERIAAMEIMLCNLAIRNLIRENKISQMYSIIQTSQAQGMQTLDMHLLSMLDNGLISFEVAYNAAINKKLFFLYGN